MQLSWWHSGSKSILSALLNPLPSLPALLICVHSWTAAPLGKAAKMGKQVHQPSATDQHTQGDRSRAHGCRSPKHLPVSRVGHQSQSISQACCGWKFSLGQMLVTGKCGELCCVSVECITQPSGGLKLHHQSFQLWGGKLCFEPSSESLSNDVATRTVALVSGSVCDNGNLSLNFWARTTFGSCIHPFSDCWRN